MARRDSFPDRQSNSLSLDYRIKILGRLGPEWAASFGGLDLEVAVQERGEAVTMLSGPVRDQSALHGLLMQLFDLGLTLVSVERLSGIIFETGREEKGA